MAYDNIAMLFELDAALCRINTLLIHFTSTLQQLLLTYVTQAHVHVASSG